MIALAAAQAAVAKHGTKFFDANLQPVVPKARQYFCEFEQHGDVLRDEALLECIGEDPRYPGSGPQFLLDGWDEPVKAGSRAVILVLQA